MEGLVGSRLPDAEGLGLASEANAIGVTPSRKRVGWGGRIRTFTILINSEVSYRLDHAPAALNDCPGKSRGSSASPQKRRDMKRIARHGPSARVECFRATHKELLWDGRARSSCRFRGEWRRQRGTYRSALERVAPELSASFYIFEISDPCNFLKHIILWFTCCSILAFELHSGRF